MSCTDPLLPIKAEFGVLEQTQVLHFTVSANGCVTGCSKVICSVSRIKPLAGCVYNLYRRLSVKPCKKVTGVLFAGYTNNLLAILGVFCAVI